MRRIVCLAFLCLAASGIRALAADANQPIAEEIISLVKAEWAAEKAGNIAEKTKSTSDDYTEFNAEADTRVDGKAVAARLEEAGWKDPRVYLVTEMLNPKVQVYGDAAILTYNFMGLRRDRDGKVEPDRAKVTRVYIKQAGRWMLVHAHFQDDPEPHS